MNKYLSYIKVIWKELLSSHSIYFASLLFLCLCALGDCIVLDNKRYCIFELLASHELLQIAKNSSDISFYTVLIEYDSSKWFTVAAAIITAFPAIRIYEINTNNLRVMILSRISRKKYVNSLFSSIYFSGVISSAIGIILYSGLVCAMFAGNSQMNEFLLNAYGVRSIDRFLYFLTKVSNCCMMCGLFPLISVLVFQLIHDRFLGITFPMMMQYIFLKLNIIYSQWMYADEMRSSSLVLKSIQILNPANCMFQYIYWKYLFELPFGCFWILLGIEILILYIIYSIIQTQVIGEKL